MFEPRFEGVDGMKGNTEMSLAVMSVGVKEERGNPVETDRFHFVNSYETFNKGDKFGRRTYNDAFQAFNSAPKELRTTIRGNLFHATQEEIFHCQRTAQVKDKQTGMHPFKFPWCEGDGRKARRWMGGDPTNFSDIPCPNLQCEYSQRKLCKATMWFYFRVRWRHVESNELVHPSFAGLPTPMIKYVSRGRHMVENFLGFFQYIEKTAAEVGIKDYILYGLPIIIQLSKKSSKVNGETVIYPVVKITPETDFFSFIQAQRKLLMFLSSGIPSAIGALSPSERDPKILEADVRMVSVPSDYSDVTVPKREKNGSETVLKAEVIPTPLVQIEKPLQPVESKKKAELTAKKYEPMPLNKLAEMAMLETIPDEKLPYFIYDTFAHYAERGKMSRPDAYKLLFGSENENGEVSVVEWDTAKKDVAVLSKFVEKARRAILNMAKAG